jgi:hypothetical protein
MVNRNLKVYGSVDHIIHVAECLRECKDEIERLGFSFITITKLDMLNYGISIDEDSDGKQELILILPPEGLNAQVFSASLSLAEKKAKVREDLRSIGLKVFLYYKGIMTEMLEKSFDEALIERLLSEEKPLFLFLISSVESFLAYEKLDFKEKEVLTPFIADDINEGFISNISLGALLDNIWKYKVLSKPLPRMAISASLREAAEKAYEELLNASLDRAKPSIVNAAMAFAKFILNVFSDFRSKEVKSATFHNNQDKFRYA